MKSGLRMTQYNKGAPLVPLDGLRAGFRLTISGALYLYLTVL